MLDGTYSGLQASVSDFLNRDDLAAVVPDFISLAEAQMQRRFVGRQGQGLPIPRRMVTVNQAFAVANAAEFINLPTDFAGPISFELPSTPTGIDLDYIEPVNLQAVKSQAFFAGSPKYYTVQGSQFQIYPVADQAYTATLVYINRFPALSNAAPSNWILTDYPDAYLYGALVQSAPYLKDDARMQAWGTLFTAAMDDICNADPMPSDKLALRTDLSQLSLRRAGYDINSDSP